MSCDSRDGFAVEIERLCWLRGDSGSAQHRLTGRKEGRRPRVDAEADTTKAAAGGGGSPPTTTGPERTRAEPTASSSLYQHQPFMEADLRDKKKEASSATCSFQGGQGEGEAGLGGSMGWMGNTCKPLNVCMDMNVVFMYVMNMYSSNCSVV